jgi:NAD+ synthase (glutamine-hydrolysing)
MTKAVLGLSGGIDSAVVAALAVEALGKDNVHGILMPSQFSTLHSISDAVDLANNLDIKYDIISIEKIYNRFMHDISPIFNKNHSWDNTQENLQARIRGTIVMAYSNRNGALALNTSNKSELASGYGTLYGDLAGSLMVIADIYKTQVYELAGLINCDREIIPHNTMVKAPSAELRTGQKDIDSLPDYSVLDPILYALIEERKSPKLLIMEGIDKNALVKVLKLRKKNSFKAFQMPQIIKVSERPLLHKSKWV